MELVERPAGKRPPFGPHTVSQSLIQAIMPSACFPPLLQAECRKCPIDLTVRTAMRCAAPPRGRSAQARCVSAHSRAAGWRPAPGCAATAIAPCRRAAMRSCGSPAGPAPRSFGSFVSGAPIAVPMRRRRPGAEGSACAIPWMFNPLYIHPAWASANTPCCRP